MFGAAWRRQEKKKGGTYATWACGVGALQTWPVLLRSSSPKTSGRTTLRYIRRAFGIPDLRH